MDALRSEEAGVVPESKHHPHVVIGPLSFGGAQAVHGQEESAEQTITLLAYGVVRIEGDWSLYPLPVTPRWPEIQSDGDLEARRSLIRSLMMIDIQRIGEELSKDLTLGDEEGN